jgi:DNA-binding transcriptional LysR family regulator
LDFGSWEGLTSRRGICRQQSRREGIERRRNRRQPACREAGFSMNIAHEVDNLYTACALVAAGLGVCLVPAGVQDSHSTSSMVLRPLTPALPHIDMHIALAYKAQSANELVPLFVDVVKEVVRKHSRPKPVRVASV